MNKRLEQSDEDLMISYKTGDSNAFDELYRRYSGRIYGFLVNRGLRPNVRDDLFQETFLKLHKSKELYAPALPFAPWLFTICRTVVLDHVKKREQPIGTIDASTVAVEPSAEAFLNVADSMKNVSTEQREVLQLRFQEGLDFREISKRLNTTPSNVRQMVSRAIRKIRGN